MGNLLCSDIKEELEKRSSALCPILEGQIRSTGRRFRLAELVSFNHSADAHAIDTAFRNFFHADHPSPRADKCMGGLRNYPGRHNRKSKSHSYAEPLADPEVKALRRNIECPAQDRLELLEVGLEPDFDLKG